MKTKLLLSFLLFTFSFLLCPAQTPQGFNYQAIARDGSGNPIVSSPIKVKLSILSDTAGFGAGTGGAYLWEEEHLNVLTNAYGLFTIVLGDPLATKVDGSAASFSVINWSVSNLYIGTKIANPTTYKVLGAAKLWSVPYALRSGETDQWQANGNNIYRQNGNVGIGTNNPTHKLEVKGGELFLPYNAGNSMLGFSTAFGNSFMFKPLDHALQIQSDHIGNPTIMFMDKSGAIGFGTNTPAYKLDIVGRIRLQTGSGSAGLWLMNTANTTERAFIGMRDDNNISLYGAGGANWGMEMNVNSGNVGIGTAGNPIAKLEVNGDIKSGIIRANAFPGVLNGGYNVGLGLGGGIELTATDGINTFIRFHHSGNSQDDIFYAGETFNFIDRLGQGQPNVRMWGNLQVDGKFGVGTTSSTSKMVIQPPATWDDNTPLFEVRNKYGTPVLAVYNNGVRILVGHDPVKGITKGGFAIGGFDNTKTVGETVNLMTVNPDSVRFNIDNGDTKGITKGGFAIGSFDQAKGIIINSKGFMNVTPMSSDNGQYNTYIGYQSGLKSNIQSVFNTFMGYQSGANNIYGDYNTFIGYQAGYNHLGYSVPGGTGNGNVYIGHLAGFTPTYGTQNCFVGYESGYQSNRTTGLVFANTFLGYQSGARSSGSSNILVGHSAGFDISTYGSKSSDGSHNIMIGNKSGAGYTTGSYNILLGPSSGFHLSTGSNNVCMGEYTGREMRSSYQNVLIGNFAGEYIGSNQPNPNYDNVVIGYYAGNKLIGNGNVIIGKDAAKDLTTISNQLFINNTPTNPLIWGDFTDGSEQVKITGKFSVTSYMGVGTTSPLTNLDVAGMIRATGAVTPSSGAGLELSYTGSVSYVESINRSTAVALPLCLAASSVYPWSEVNLGTASKRWNYIYAKYTTIQTSDARLKKDISDLDYGLESILQLRPVSYRWKEGSDGKKQLGLLAQDVLKVIKEVVDIGDDEDNTLGISYSSLIPVLIKGIQQQQLEIETQNDKIARLEKIVEEMQVMIGKSGGK